MYDFNISLKSFLFEHAIENRYDQWCYNCCRQTAVFGYFVLKSLFPEYHYRTFEAEFDDKILGHDTHYDHCFIVAEKDDRNILIDMARTTNPLVFHPFGKVFEYPDVKEFKDMKLTKVNEFYCEPLWKVEEYITGIPTYEIVDFLIKSSDFYNVIKDKDEAVRLMYSMPIIKVNEVLKSLE